MLCAGDAESRGVLCKAAVMSFACLLYTSRCNILCDFGQFVILFCDQIHNRLHSRIDHLRHKDKGNRDGQRNHLIARAICKYAGNHRQQRNDEAVSYTHLSDI